MPRLRGLKPAGSKSVVTAKKAPYTHAPFEGIETVQVLRVNQGLRTPRIPMPRLRGLKHTGYCGKERLHWPPYTHAPFEGIETGR